MLFDQLVDSARAVGHRMVVDGVVTRRSEPAAEFAKPRWYCNGVSLVHNDRVIGAGRPAGAAPDVQDPVLRGPTSARSATRRLTAPRPTSITTPMTRARGPLEALVSSACLNGIFTVSSRVQRSTRVVPRLLPKSGEKPAPADLHRLTR